MDVVLIFIQVSKVERELGGNLSSISASIEASLPENTATGQSRFRGTIPCPKEFRKTLSYTIIASLGGRSFRYKLWQPDRQVKVICFGYTWTAIGVLGYDYLPAFICLPGNHRHYAETLWLR